MALWFELLGVLLFSFVLNLIPFAGPSNLLIAFNVALPTHSDPFTIGFLVALGSATAKFIHYIVTFFIGGHIGRERRERLNATMSKFGRWASLALFVVAATPIPDEPVVIPLGLLKYSPIKFFFAYFLGKLSITIAGAFLGRMSGGFFGQFISPEAFIVISIVLTIIITVVLLEVDVAKLAKSTLRRKGD